MKQNILERIRLIIFPTDQKSRNQLYVFLVCIALSIFIWVLIKLSEEDVSELKYTVELINSPEGKILVEGGNQYLTLGFEEKASDIFFLRYIKQKKPVVISLANLPLRKSGNRYEGVVFPSHLTDYISRQQELDYKIVSISPDTLRFFFEDKIMKKVPVFADVEITLGQQRMLYDSIRIIPDSVLLSGPESAVLSINSVNMNPVILSGVTDSLLVSASVLIPDPVGLLEASPSEVQVEVPVEEFTEAKTTVKIIAYSSKYNQIRTFPETIEVSYWVALSDYKKVVPGMFRAVADIDPAIESNSDRVQVELEKFPDIARNIRLNPEKVEYIIINQ